MVQIKKPHRGVGLTFAYKEPDQEELEEEEGGVTQATPSSLDSQVQVAFSHADCVSCTTHASALTFQGRKADWRSAIGWQIYLTY